MGHGQQCGGPRANYGDRALPGLDVDVGGWGRRDDDRIGSDTYPADVTYEGDRVVPVGDVVRRVPGCVGDLEVSTEQLLAADQGVEVGLRDGMHIAPQAVHVIAVETGSAVHK